METGNPSSSGNALKAQGSVKPSFQALPRGIPAPMPPVLLPGGSQAMEGLWESPKELNTRTGSRAQDGPRAVGAVNFPGIARVLPTHLLESELVGKSTFDVLILAGGVQVVGAHLGKHKPVREPGKAGKAPRFQFHQSPNPCPGRSCPKAPQGPAQLHGAALLRMEYLCGNASHSALEAFFSKTRRMRKTRNIPFFCQGKPRRHRSDQLTKSTVFLRFVSVSVSSTKLSHLPLQSSGSSGTRGTQNPWDSGVLGQLNSSGLPSPCWEQPRAGPSCALALPFPPGDWGVLLSHPSCPSQPSTMGQLGAQR